MSESSDATEVELVATILELCLPRSEPLQVPITLLHRIIAALRAGQSLQAENGRLTSEVARLGEALEGLQKEAMGLLAEHKNCGTAPHINTAVWLETLAQDYPLTTAIAKP